MSARRLAGALLPVALAAASPARAAETKSCAPDLAALKGWSGVWAAEGIDASDQGLSGRGSRNADYKFLGFGAPWSDAGWARMAAMLRGIGAGTNQSGWGFPMMMASFSELKFVIAPAETAIINQYREIRSVYTDGRGHMPEDERWPTVWGDSTGCWDGDTLVIDTVSVRFDQAFSLVGPPLSEQAHFVERLRLVAPGRIEAETTITDPATLSEPWIVRVTYVPAGIDRLVQDAFEDRNDSVAGTIRPPRGELVPLPLPRNVALSSAELDRVVGRYTLDGSPFELLVERRGERLFFTIPPIQPGFLPMYAQAPLSFESIDGGKLRFIADAAGQVIGFEGTQPDGSPGTGKRKSP